MWKLHTFNLGGERPPPMKCAFGFLRFLLNNYVVLAPLTFDSLSDMIRPIATRPRGYVNHVFPFDEVLPREEYIRQVGAFEAERRDRRGCGKVVRDDRIGANGWMVFGVWRRSTFDICNCADDGLRGLQLRWTFISIIG